MTNKRTIIIIIIALFAGMIGMKLANWITDMYYDHEFLHTVRISAERNINRK